MKEHISISKGVQKIIAEKLREDEWFGMHRVSIIEQDSEELAFILESKLEAIEGPVLIVGTDAIANNYPAAEVTVFVNATEMVPTNRATQGFATAIAAVEAAIDDIDGPDWRWTGDLRHETPQENSGILVASASFKGLVERVGFEGKGEDGKIRDNGVNNGVNGDALEDS